MPSYVSSRFLGFPGRSRSRGILVSATQQDRRLDPSNGRYDNDPEATIHWPAKGKKEPDILQIIVHPTLQAQREVLSLVQSERRQAILNMLAPFDPMMTVMVPPQMDPITMFGLIRPDGPVEAYREALNRLEAVDAEEICRQALHKADEAIARTGYRPPIETVQFGLFLWDSEPQLTQLAQGYTGFGGIPGFIMVNLWPDSHNLPRLGACVAHEFHHQVRLCIEPWRVDISVAEYIVMEGLAESFAAEIYGPEFVGPWVSEVRAENLEKARGVVGGALEVRGFNEVRAYIFGDEIMSGFGAPPRGVPAHAGYAVGYHLVQAYLAKTGLTVVEATLMPSAEIVRVAEYV